MVSNMKQRILRVESTTYTYMKLDVMSSWNSSRVISYEPELLDCIVCTCTSLTRQTMLVELQSLCVLSLVRNFPLYS